MRLETLTVRGMLRFRDAVTIDLRTLPAGLIAVCGANGEGKTTIVESGIAALYRTFPSRADRELFDYATERDSYVEALYAVEGRGSYRARVNLDPVKRTSDAVLEQLLPDGSKAVLNDGKVSTFDQAVAGVFPAREVLLASAVAAQNKAGSFVTLDKKSRKDLFSRLLGLEHYEAMATTARTAAGFCEQARVKLAAQREMLERDAAPDIGQMIDVDDARVALERSQYAAARSELQATIAALEGQRATLQTDAQRHAAATTRVTSLTEQAHTARARLDDWRRQVTTAEKTAAQDRELRHELRARHVADFDERIANNDKLRADAEAIRAAARALETCVAEIAAAKADAQDAEQAMEASRAERRQLDARAQTERHMHAMLERAREDAAILDTVPCQGAGGFADCQFLTRAVKAQTSIADPVLQAQASGLAETEVAIAEQQQRYDAHNAMSAAARARWRDAEALLQRHTPRAKLLPKVELAEARLVELRRDRETAITEADQQIDAIQARLADVLEALTRQSAEAADAIASSETALAEAQRDADSTRQASEHLARVDVALTSARRSWDASTTDLARLEATIQDLVRRRERWQQACAQLADVDARLAQVEQHSVEWQLLVKALGREGLPVLEIDAAGPTVSSFTNDLLGVCFGPRFTVELVTQTAKADGKGTKEVFELKVLDNLRGGDARDMGDLSGGEQILVDEALKNALALFVNSRNVSPIETCWRDETTGPLDPDNASKYLDMLRRVMQIGGFWQVIFVTHNAEAAASADAQIRVSDGQVSFAFPPYMEAA